MNDLALYAVIGIALAFDFTNGFHDAPNSIATVVATRLLTPRLAVLWAAGFTFLLIALRVAGRAHRVERLHRGFRRLQLVSAGAYSLGHGGNDAQKTMGVILALLIATNKVAPTSDVPLWVVLAAHSAIALGTLSGGWRVVHTLGSRITKLQPSGGVAAESAAAATLFFVSAHGIPVSTTHTITGAIVGVGSIQRLSAVRWGGAGPVVWAWILTIPGAAIVSALAYLVLRAF